MKEIPFNDALRAVLNQRDNLHALTVLIDELGNRYNTLIGHDTESHESAPARADAGIYVNYPRHASAEERFLFVIRNELTKPFSKEQLETVIKRIEPDTSEETLRYTSQTLTVLVKKSRLIRCKVNNSNKYTVNFIPEQLEPLENGDYTPKPGFEIPEEFLKPFPPGCKLVWIDAKRLS